MNNNTPATSNLFRQALNPSLNPADATWRRVYGQNVAPEMVNAQGAVYDVLYGGVDNPYLSGMAGDMVNRTRQSYGDMSRDVIENLNSSILPGIQDDFQAAGSLGASRQALMQGEAVGRTMDALAREGGDLNTNLMGQMSNLYGSANEANENRMASLAGQLASQDAAARMAEAQMRMQAGLANQDANLAAQNMDTQRMSLQQQAASMIPQMATLPLYLDQQLLNAYSPLLGQQQTSYDLLRDRYYEAANAPYDALQRFASLVSPGAGLGGTTTTEQPTYGTNPLAALLPLLMFMP